MIKGVITGDLVKSTNIAAEWRQPIMYALKACAADFATITPVKIEMYRGDSFQVVVDRADCTLAVAIALRAKLKAITPDGSSAWDARVSAGIGSISFESDNVLTSDGEAFRLSGRAFDTIGKRKLSISTPWPEMNYALDLVTKFADELISSWTAKQAKVAYHSILFLKTQKDMAEDLGMTRQNFNFHWGTSKTQLILDYIEYFKALLAKYNRQ